MWRCHGTGGPFPLDAIDSLGSGDCTGTIQLLYDVDGDGYTDIVTTDVGLGTGKLAITIRGGPMAGTGCQRTVPIRWAAGTTTGDVRQLWGSVTGGLRLLQMEDDGVRPSEDRPIQQRLVLYDVEIESRDTVMVATLTPRDTLRGTLSLSGDAYNSTFHHLSVHPDPVMGVDRLIAGYDTRLRIYELTSGHFDHVTTAHFGYRHPNYLGYDLGTKRPVVAVGIPSLATPDRRTRVVLCHADDFSAMAIMHGPGAATSSSSLRFTAIEDQTGDRQPDILYTFSTWDIPKQETTLMLGVATLDSSMYADLPELVMPTGMRITGDILELTLEDAVPLTIHIATIDGRLLAPVVHQAMAGYNTVDLPLAFPGLPRGVYHVRVQGDGITRVASYLRW